MTDGQDPLDEATVLHLKHHGLDGTRLWTEATSGFALRRGAGDGDADGIAEVDLVVHPDARGRGLGSRLAARALAEPGAVAAWSHGGHPAAARLAEAHGLDRVRDLWVLRRPITTDPAAALPALSPPDGVDLRPFEVDRDGETEALLRINAAAFAEHPEQGDLDATGLAERMGEDWWDPAGLILGVDASSGDLLGFHWTKQHSPDLGEVYVVGISPAAQGRGLGTTLTLAGLHHLAARGVAEILLYVESDNAAAVAVYTGLGFTHAASDTHVRYHRYP